ncbi:hypothetical protein D3C77_579200 [compost metagenome]
MVNQLLKKFEYFRVLQYLDFVQQNCEWHCAVGDTLKQVLRSLLGVVRIVVKRLRQHLLKTIR